ncbi:hypothetical protein FEM48_Zijuj11G0017300 [Ziziphus jujuba var. spinosa]|uniref:Uncharacterized protein n=1 Tax=Ziziphus jujuba var. spinosa TaxID=714518 RepID=A0A978UG39_ZIZJJ|nr:hypothetical protein FEM48_Zijuj11G0017300 [Ziziphus jujuba var. spinosa]
MCCMDEYHRRSQDSGYILVIDATNRPDDLEPALRRAGRFEGSFRVMKIATSTTGYFPADIDSLLTESTYTALGRLINKSKEFKEKWWMERWLHKAEVIQKVQSSSKREGFSTIPDVKWEDVGELNDIRQMFDPFIVSCVKYTEQNKINSLTAKQDNSSMGTLGSANGDADERGVILNALGKGSPKDPSVNLNDIGRHEACHNFIGNDLKFLMKEALMAAQDEAIANISSSDTSQWTIKA